MEQNPSGSNDADQPGRVDAALPATEPRNERTPLVIRWSVKAAVLLANGYVLFFFSERVFWSFPRPNELGQGDNTSLASFTGHALACSLLFLGSWGVLGRVRSEAFQVGRAEAGFLFGLAALLFLFARVPARPLAAWILPALLLLAGIGLRRSAGHADRRDLLDECLGRIHAANVVALDLIPLTTIAVYAPFRLLGFYPATNVVLYLATMPLGFWFFLRALWPRRRRAMREEPRCNTQPEAVK